MFKTKAPEKGAQLLEKAQSLRCGLTDSFIIGSYRLFFPIRKKEKRKDSQIYKIMEL